MTPVGDNKEAREEPARLVSLLGVNAAIPSDDRTVVPAAKRWRQRLPVED